MTFMWRASKILKTSYSKSMSLMSWINMAEDGCSDSSLVELSLYVHVRHVC